MQRTSDLMRHAATAFLAALTPEQRDRAMFPFDDDERQTWYYFPMPRRGIAFRELDPHQWHLGHALISAGVSPEGAVKTSLIMSLEDVLYHQEQERFRQMVREGMPERIAGVLLEHGGYQQIAGAVRSAEGYFLTLFGEPSPGQTWGWRVEGHHVSLNVTLINGQQLVAAPCFFGANPAEIREGPRAGLRVLAAEEDCARDLLASLDDEQRQRAIIADEAPAEILSTNLRRAEHLGETGLPAIALTAGQRERLMALLQVYTAAMPPEVATARMAGVIAIPWDRLTFAWAGSVEPGQGHYYRIQSPTFLVEYDNTQDNANHIHTVWRQFDGDWGQDLLARHLQEAHAG